MTIWYGGDYNPEQWTEDVWPQDVRLMRRAGVNIATVGVFSWARIQPAEGVFDYDWLDRVLDLLHRGGIAVDLATGTASPPPWAVQAYPDMLPVNQDGVTLWPGSRQHYAPTSPDYRRLATDLTRATARRYRDHPAVVMWHPNNELGCHVAYDYSDHAAYAFRDWLRDRYGTIDAVNEAWGTWFWSQHYTDFAQVLPPRRTPYHVNPSALLDFRRFSSDALRELFRMEKHIIREAGATQPVTTNMMGPHRPTDYWAWSEDIDVISDDSYPDPADPLSYQVSAFARDLMRSLKPGRSWILMEQAPGAVNWRPANAAKAPGQMAALSMQAVGRGADGVMFFQWRQATAGSEKFHSAMLPHAGTETRTYREISALGQELSGWQPPAPGGEAKVAIVFDWHNWWAIDQTDHPATVDYLATVRGWHAAFLDLAVQVDIVRPDGPFDAYELVVAPSLYLIRDAAALAAYDRHLLVTAFSDVVDEHDRFLPGGFTTRLGPALGVSVLDFEGVRETEIAVFGGAIAGGTLAETIRVDDAEILGIFPDGRPALTRRGNAHYVATLLDGDGRATVARYLIERADIRPVMTGLPPGVEACARGDLITLINHNPEPVQAGEFSLGPYGYQVIEQAP
ncbi:beta-galactosidase [Mangrovihabitans endophyticus]|uniref:Beta-galactosidase n=1 Tax=Mangrovihabitans endophyticus TaxID=1751298 RepID=A0A8J3FRW5_9ACTN|nr:beta-galactosidase [Mangrovihabitans endophyticus]GGL15092.1 beta-galactosidase [Mangrovihabitans endophyticus]